jgi:hypothetical protein
MSPQDERLIERMREIMGQRDALNVTLDKALEKLIRIQAIYASEGLHDLDLDALISDIRDVMRETQ